MFRSRDRIWTLQVAVILGLFLPTARPVWAQQRPSEVPASVYSDLPWRYIGPEGNRISAVAGVAGDPRIYYAGAASGGVFKTKDGGVTWKPVFDDQPVLSVGSIAVSPSDPDVIWVGTGEGKIRSNISVGQGVYKSSDGGETWALMGLETTGRIPRLVIHPDDPNTVLVCALGHAYGPQTERGIFRTVDGGTTWDRVLFVDEDTGCSDIAMSSEAPSVLYAGMWQLEIHTWGRESGGPGSGLFRSTDGGATWTRLTSDGLPSGPLGKVAVAIAPSNPERVYALIETGNGIPWRGQETERGQLWRSDDGGDGWRMVTADRAATERPHYYSRMLVAPDNENEVFFLTGKFATSPDGGETIVPQTRWLAAPGADHHDMWIDPTDPDRMIVGHDLGVSISIARGNGTWNRITLPNAQMYHVNVDNQIPYSVYGNRQDGPGYRGPSNSRRGASAEVPITRSGRGGDPRIPKSMWHTLNNGESGWATPDPVDPNIIWTSGSGSGHLGGVVDRYEENRRQFREVEVWPERAGGPPADLKYRFNWTMPLAMSPHDRHKIYVGSQYVHQTTDDGQSWQIISPDLTLNDKTRQQSSGGLTPENNGVDYAGVVFAIDESPIQPGLIWIGTNDGLVQVTRDGGATWTNVTQNIPDLPEWGTVTSIDASRYDAGTAYLTVDLHQVNNRDPFVYRTGDFGATWSAITRSIPRSMLSYAHCIREDPVRPGLLYLGTENAIYVSFDDGENWQPLQMNMPHAPVYGIVVQEHFDDLVVGTYGRGVWILDDLSPIQQMDPEVLATDVHLFPPRPAYRFRQITNYSVMREDEPAIGFDPPYGAAINYYLKGAPTGGVTITILDSTGQTVRTLAGSQAPGINRVHWNLRYETTEEIHVLNGPVGSGASSLSVLAPPGNYMVRLAVDGSQFSEPLVVRKDPHSAGTEADILEQMRMLFSLQRMMESAVTMVNEIEILRAQLGEVLATADDPEIRSVATDLETQAVDLEEHFVEVRVIGMGRGAEPKFMTKVGYLAENLGRADFKPTDSQLEVRDLLQARLSTWQAQWDLLRARGHASILSAEPGGA